VEGKVAEGGDIVTRSRGSWTVNPGATNCLTQGVHPNDLSKVVGGGMGRKLLRKRLMERQNYLQIILGEFGKLRTFVPKSNLRAGERKGLSRFF
jgi:hypothetical protein